ncbi:Hypothetical predicted protein [Olea europaea subsp. europaea]|uniref:Uncharacterized protein n=1 Tax=Olea europaea subsp. europaea TaxID=158383 RepID=A0A8S0Q4Z4_OLEEU|nr:Hypothetical predicted protein [Olea europaea subsp. europaea]
MGAWDVLKARHIFRVLENLRRATSGPSVATPRVSGVRAARKSKKGAQLFRHTRTTDGSGSASKAALKPWGAAVPRPEQINTPLPRAGPRGGSLNLMKQMQPIINYTGHPEHGADVCPGRQRVSHPHMYAAWGPRAIKPRRIRPRSPARAIENPVAPAAQRSASTTPRPNDVFTNVISPLLHAPIPGQTTRINLCKRDRFRRGRSSVREAEGETQTNRRDPGKGRRRRRESSILHQYITLVENQTDNQSPESTPRLSRAFLYFPVPF